MNSEPTTLDEALERFDELLEEEKLDEARATLELAKKLGGTTDVDVRLAEAELAFHAEGLTAAVALVEILTRDIPDSAEAWYALGQLRIDEEKDEAAIACFVRVHELDAELDEDLEPVDPAILDRIESVARDLIEALPPKLGDRLHGVPIVLEERPSRALVEDGFDPRALGLFDGNEDGSEPAPVPTRIVLYTTCLVDAFGDGDELDEQVEVTVLHELGHYFGLDEAEVEKLGLA